MSAGKDYAILRSVVSVNITGYGCFPIDDYHTSFHLWKDRNKNLQLIDVCELHFLDMVRFRDLRKRGAAGGFTLDDPLAR